MTRFITSFVILHIIASGLYGDGLILPMTLVHPFGARQISMGNVGAALADDESTVFWNPAGLGIQNIRWQCGAFSQFHELFLLGILHEAFSACYQPSSKP